MSIPSLILCYMLFMYCVCNVDLQYCAEALLFECLGSHSLHVSMRDVSDP